MPSFFVYTDRTRPGLHIWREGTSIKRHLIPENPGPGWVEFKCDDLDTSIDKPVRFMLFSYADDDSFCDWENDVFQRELPRLPSGEFPPNIWFVSGSSRVVLTDPQLGSETKLRVHLISRTRFRPGEMYIWDPVRDENRRVAQVDYDALGPYFDVNLSLHERSFFNFKFIRKEEGAFTDFESDAANRWWVSDDGSEIWTHSSDSAVASAEPVMRTLTMHVRHSISAPPVLHLWAQNGEYITDISGTFANGWTTFTTQIYTHLPYACLIHNPSHDDEWEHEEAKRTHLVITGDQEWWTLEGDRALFTSEPVPDVRLNLTIANADLSDLRGSKCAHVWINRARGPLLENVAVDNAGNVSLDVYPEVITSIKFHDDHGNWEKFRHAIQLKSDMSPLHRYVVLERPPLLSTEPPADLVQDPPFRIRRPGAYAEGDELRFVVHTPHAADIRLIGEWTDWMQHPVQLRITRDGTYWWASVNVSDVLEGLGGLTDYHGAKYQFLLNQVDRRQDPAAGWVETSKIGAASRLVNHARFDWGSKSWDRPATDHYVIYQLHPSRFTNRFQSERPLRRVAQEIADNSAYFKELGVTAIQLLPVNEVSSTNSWGYDPAYFYTVENDYCGPEGPDDLKHLVRTAHEHGLAVVLDVVFNHAGGDNILWEIARDSFFDGDTKWGALVNFDHPQCLHFFAQNLVYLANEFRIDAFRLDHTATIVHSAAWDNWSGSVRKLGSGGGWEFLHGIRHAVKTQVPGNCPLMAEHLPNEWSMTNYGGPMDSQWGDDFHDRLIEACGRKFGVMPRLADALKLTHTQCDDWSRIVSYPESHDEVGNVPDRVARVAGFGQGWRMSKVAAAATLLSRGIPLYFMGLESGEHKQFKFGSDEQLDIDEYLANPDRRRIRAWWRELGWLHRNPNIKGPSPLDVCFADGQMLAFTRGQNGDFFVLLNFGGWSGRKSLAQLNLPWGEYRELYNSTWPVFAIPPEHEGEHTNGGRSARLHGGHTLHIPDYGVVILEKI
jgi:1,4-alpha-glucan branching enzyme